MKIYGFTLINRILLLKWIILIRIQEIVYGIQFLFKYFTFYLKAVNDGILQEHSICEK